MSVVGEFEELKIKCEELQKFKEKIEEEDKRNFIETTLMSETKDVQMSEEKLEEMKE